MNNQAMAEARVRVWVDKLLTAPSLRRVAGLALPFAAGAVLALSFNSAVLSGAAVAGIFLLLLRRPESLSGWLLHWLVAAVTFFGVLLFWLTSVTVVGWAALTLALSLWWAALAALLWPLRRLRGARWALAFAAAWVLVEYLRSQGPYGFAWGLLAYSQQPDSMAARLVPVGGVLALSFAAALAAAYLAELWRGRREGGRPGWLAPALALPLVLVGTIGIATAPSAQTIEVALIQPGVPQQLKWDAASRAENERRLMDLTLEALRANPRLVVWPEAPLIVPLEEQPQLLHRLQALSVSSGAMLLIGSHHRQDGKLHNSAFLIDGETVQRYDKSHLVPFGEYLPARSLLGWLPETRLITEDFSPGDGPGILRARDLAVSPLICFESTDWRLAGAGQAGGADLFTVMTDDSWFAGTAELEQHARIARFRALEQGVPLVQAANTGQSFVAYPNGAIAGQLPVDTAGVAVAQVPEATPVNGLPPEGAALMSLLAFLGTVLRSASLRGAPALPRAARSPSSAE